jgi:hypothetical protein
VCCWVCLLVRLLVNWLVILCKVVVVVLVIWSGAWLVLHLVGPNTTPNRRHGHTPHPGCMSYCHTTRQGGRMHHLRGHQ